MRSRVVPIVSTTAAVGLMLSGCGSTDTGSAAETAAHSGDTTVSVLAGFYPFEFVTSRVGGDAVTVENLTQPGAEPHDLELTPQQVGAVTEADLVVYLEGFQPSVDEAVERSGPSTALQVSDVVPLAGIDALNDQGHDLTGDPHIWLDPTKLAEVVTAVGGVLAKIDKVNAHTYLSNAGDLVAELEDLDAEYTEGLRQCKRNTFVVSHSAFGHLAAAYGLEQVGISGLSPEADPPPARIAEVHEIAGEEGLTTIFYETLVSPDVAETIAGDLRLQTAVLDPIEAQTDPDGADYLEVMRANLEALRTANGCS